MARPISKTDAAVRQLIAAVHMFFDGGDPVPIYVLAAASREILSTKLAKAKQTSSLDLISRATGREQKGVLKELHRYASFFKHADRDPEGVLTEFDEREVDIVLFAACHDFQELTGGGAVEVQAFDLWWLAVYEAYPAPEPGIVKDIREVFPDIKTLSREKQRRVGRELLQWAAERPGAAEAYQSGQIGEP